MKKTVTLMLFVLTSIIASAQVAPWPVREKTAVRTRPEVVKAIIASECKIEDKSFDMMSECQKECANSVARVYQVMNRPYDTRVNQSHCVTKDAKIWKCSLKVITNCEHKAKDPSTVIRKEKQDSETAIKPAMTPAPADNTRVNLPQAPASQKTN